MKHFGHFHSHHQTGKSASQSYWLQRSAHKPGDPIPRKPRPYSTYHTRSAYAFYLRCGLWVHLSRKRARGQASNQNHVSVRDPPPAILLAQEQHFCKRGTLKLLRCLSVQLHKSSLPICYPFLYLKCSFFFIFYRIQCSICTFRFPTVINFPLLFLLSQKLHPLI